MTTQGALLTKTDGEDDFLLRISSIHGGYGTENKKDWFCTTPNGLFGSLGKHSVIEHEDGTITVNPSILVSQGNIQWHGHLERGIWREC